MDIWPDGGARDCPECGGRGTVLDGLCDLCFADLDEHPDRVAAGAATAEGRLRFEDVLAELRVVVTLAGIDAGGGSVAAAGERAERLLGSLRAQFLRDLGLPLVGPAGATT